MFAFQDKRSSVEVAFTDRFGGLSTGPYAELNLSVPRASTEDGPERLGEEAAAVRTSASFAPSALKSAGTACSAGGLRAPVNWHAAFRTALSLPSREARST